MALVSNSDSGKKPDPGSGWKDFLELTPTRNRAARVGEADDGSFAVRVAVKPPWWLVPPLNWIVPMSGERLVKLDPLGRMIWDYCDDARRVEDLVDMLAASEGLTFHEARVAVTQYLRELVRRGVVVLVAITAGS